MPGFWGDTVGFFRVSHGWVLFLAVWSVFWKGVALWNAARRKDKAWFIAFMLIHTAGLLELFYLLFVTNTFMEKPVSEKSPPAKPPVRKKI